MSPERLAPLLGIGQLAPPAHKASKQINGVVADFESIALMTVELIEPL